MHPDDFQLPKGSIKKGYLKKFPLIRTAEDGTVTVVGVSNKQIPCPVPWREPAKIERWMPGEHGSGDMDDLASLVTNKNVDISQPRLEYEASKELLECSPELKRVRFLGRTKLGGEGTGKSVIVAISLGTTLVK